MMLKGTQTKRIGEWNEGISEAGGFIRPKGKTQNKTGKFDKNQFMQDYRHLSVIQT